MSGIRFGCHVPVEPLSHQAWTRIESTVFARLEDRRALAMPLSYPPASQSVGGPHTLGWRWRASAGFVLGTAAIASVIHMTRASGAGPEPEPFAVTDSAEDGLHVATGADTRSVAIGDHRLTLSDHSEIVARGDDGEGWQVELSRGRIELDVAPRGDRPQFIIRSGDVEVRIVGTLLSVWREGASTEVHVSRGIVELEQRGRVVRLRPGDRWRDGTLSGTAHGTTGAARESDTSQGRRAAHSASESRSQPLAGIRRHGHWFDPSPEDENVADVESLRARLGTGRSP